MKGSALITCVRETLIPPRLRFQTPFKPQTGGAISICSKFHLLHSTILCNLSLSLKKSIPMAHSSKSDSNLVSGEPEHLEQAHAGHVQEDEESFIYAMQAMNSTILSMSLQTAFELGVFEAMAGAGEGARLSAKEIAALVCCANPEAPAMLDRVLRLLASHSLVDCRVEEDEEGSKQRMYGLSPVSKYFVTDDNGVSLGPVLALINDKVFMESWSELKGAIKEGGIAFNRVHGMHAFEYPRLDQRFNDVFNNAMHNSTALIMNTILKSYNGFKQFNKIVDVGGGLGVNLYLITSKYPCVHGINFDLPHVLKHAPNYPGVQHVGGDMFESVPQGDAIFMKWILHDWSDDQCLKLLKNCHKAIPENGVVIAVETVLPIEPNTSASVKSAFQADVLMMTQNPGGKERTQHEFIHLASQGGFNVVRFVTNVCGLWVMEFYK